MHRYLLQKLIFFSIYNHNTDKKIFQNNVNISLSQQLKVIHFV
jgi:hypothetical protein